MTFHTWLTAQLGRQAPIGDLARDALTDAAFPRFDAKTSARTVRRECLAHLRRMGAIEGAEDALKAAISEWDACRKAKKAIKKASPGVAAPGCAREERP